MEGGKGLVWSGAGYIDYSPFDARVCGSGGGISYPYTPFTVSFSRAPFASPSPSIPLNALPVFRVRFPFFLFFFTM